MEQHPNISPNFMPMSELAHWGDQHSDPWVRKLAEVVGDLVHNLPRETDIIEFLNDPLREMRDMENDLANIQSDLDQSESENEKCQNKIKALTLQLSEHETDAQIDAYRARVYEMTEDSKNLRNRVAKLEKERDDLEAKLDTWKVMTS